MEAKAPFSRGKRATSVVDPFDAQQLTAIADLADTVDGLTGAQIGYLLGD